MNLMRYHPYRYEGMRLNKNIYSPSGVLVLPAFTLLTRKELDMLGEFEIVLHDDDVEDESILQLVNAAIKEMKQLFEKLQYSDRIPYHDYRQKLIPIVQRLSQYMELKPFLTHFERYDEYTYRHSIGVALLSEKIGKIVGVKEEELQELMIAGLLHDIGKAKVPVAVMNKPGKLTPEEFEQVKSHTVLGYEIIKNTSDTTPRQAIVALQHHEREDGSGYPLGLKGGEIDQFSKIVGIADIFHAMISKRVYKDPLPLERVLVEMSNYAFNILEPSITLRFIQWVMEMAVGNHVLLSNGSIGKIVLINANNPTQPLVEVNGHYIDLSKESSVGLKCFV